MDNNQISINADIVLQLMNNTPSGLTYNELKERCHLSDKDLSMAIGRLVRENKIMYLSDLDNDRLYLNVYFYF